LNTNQREMLNMLLDENSRTGPRIQDPITKNQSYMSSISLEGLKKRHQFLCEYPEELLSSTNLDTILKLESTSMKLRALEKAGDSSDRLSSNRDTMESTFYAIREGRDNRSTIIDPARYLPGCGASANKIWLTGRDHVGTKGHQPIATYDMAAIGLAGHVTNKGWVELHNPGSSNLTLKLFSINNCTARTARAANTTESDNMEEIIELGEFKSALRVLREAMRHVHPWNPTVAALEGFFIQTNFCAANLEGLEKKATILTNFTDYVLKENSNRWRSKESFLSTPDLKGAWDSFFGARPQSMLVKTKKPTPPGQNNFSQPRTGTGPLPFHLFRENICVMFNVGKCLKAPGQCRKKDGSVLRHVCNFRPGMNPNLPPCNMNHAACFFH